MNGNSVPTCMALGTESRVHGPSAIVQARDRGACKSALQVPRRRSATGPRDPIHYMHQSPTCLRSSQERFLQNLFLCYFHTQSAFDTQSRRTAMTGQLEETPFHNASAQNQNSLFGKSRKGLHRQNDIRIASWGAMCLYTLRSVGLKVRNCP